MLRLDTGVVLSMLDVKGSSGAESRVLPSLQPQTLTKHKAVGAIISISISILQVSWKRTVLNGPAAVSDPNK